MSWRWRLFTSWISFPFSFPFPFPFPHQLSKIKTSHLISTSPHQTKNVEKIFIKNEKKKKRNGDQFISQLINQSVSQSVNQSLTQSVRSSQEQSGAVRSSQEHSAMREKPNVTHTKRHIKASQLSTISSQLSPLSSQYIHYTSIIHLLYYTSPIHPLHIYHTSSILYISYTSPIHLLSISYTSPLPTLPTLHT